MFEQHFRSCFYDENENGVFDEGELPLTYQEITLLPDNITVITDDSGYYWFPCLPVDTYSLELSSSTSFPFNTTTNPVNTLLWTSQTIDFGISDEEPDFAICIDFYPMFTGYPCDALVNHNLCFRNMSNVTIDGVLEVEYDNLFQGYQEVTEIDSVIGNIVYMSFENLPPGQMYFMISNFILQL